MTNINQNSDDSTRQLSANELAENWNHLKRIHNAGENLQNITAGIASVVLGGSASALTKKHFKNDAVENNVQPIQNKLAVLQSWDDSQVVFIDKEDSLNVTTVKDVKTAYEEAIMKQTELAETHGVIGAGLTGLAVGLFACTAHMMTREKTVPFFKLTALSIFNWQDRRKEAKTQNRQKTVRLTSLENTPIIRSAHSILTLLRLNRTTPVLFQVKSHYLQ